MNNELLLLIKNKKIQKYNDLEDMVYRVQLTYTENTDILGLKYNPTKRIGYSIPPGMYKIIDINFMLKYLLPKEVKADITIDDDRLKSNLKIIKLFYLLSHLFQAILGFTSPNSYPLDDIEGFYQLIAGSYKSDRPINITGIDKVHLKCDCVDGRIVNDVRESILYSFALSSPLGRKIYKEPRFKLCKKIDKPILISYPILY